ncbi:RNA polymerase factor sigma C [Bacillus canaveralius]|uniref:RNA polymerase factor sigma C n=1 Tax=Bacillus canaveralius TaxID=1403243 RepID=A0A2N5GSR8_9BACI|nr:sigma-70 family RNA polymerase sigma factor [Bacillus canaveralius]PLR86821.1 RNA polymerase factor sigma C [Bacillus canaveralius]PLR92718.1 RNA polymerase factor sigma C [Bacillus canaveralius]RSK53668.1 sigma-70 family RNA polymerase sigma factor [Bacillus canaveralius]
MATNHCNASSFTEIQDHHHFPITNRDIWLNELMNNYGEDIVRLAYSYVRDKSAAEDIAQNTFIKCYKYASAFRGDSTIKTWLYRIAINCCKDYLRSSYFKRILPTNIIQNFIQEPSPSTESVYFESDKSNALIQCVFGLPPKYREVIMLHYFENLKIKEIEQILDLKGNTIKTRLRKARTMLKEKIEKEKGGYNFE